MIYEWIQKFILHFLMNGSRDIEMERGLGAGVFCGEIWKN
jgi:hypothetical protein